MERCLGALAIALLATVAAACGSNNPMGRATPTTQPGTQPAPVPATPAQVRRCTPRGGRVLAVSHEAVVYTLPRLTRADPVASATSAGVALLGCIVGQYRRTELDTLVNLGKTALNGTTVAYSTSRGQGVDTIATEITVADIRLGHRLFTVPAGHVAVVPHFVSVDAVAVTQAGAVAWVQHGGTTESPGYSVHAASTAKPGDHELASGTAIDPHSLRLSGVTASWVEGGRRRSAAI